MLDLGQRVLNLFENCTKKIVPYALALASSSKRRSYAGIAKSLNVNYDYIYNFLKSIDE